MHKYWAWLGLNLGKHAIAVGIIGAIVTIGLGYGITQLEFATGQDSYLNRSDQVYKDSVKYQDLFGGQAMLTLASVEPGHSVKELFTPENLQQWRAVERKLRASDQVFNVVSPVTALEFTDALVSSPSGDPPHWVPTITAPGTVHLH